MTIQNYKLTNSSRLLVCVQDLPFVCQALPLMMASQHLSASRAFSLNPDRGPFPDFNSPTNIDIRSRLDPSSWAAVDAFFQDDLVVPFGERLGQVSIGQQERDPQGRDLLAKQLLKCLNKVNFDNNESRVVNHMLEFTIRKYRSLEACLASEQSSRALRCIPRVFQMLGRLKGNIGVHLKQLKQLEGWICCTVGMFVLDIGMLENNDCFMDLTKVNWAICFLNRANVLLKDVWRDLNAVEHQARLHLRLAELALILRSPDDIEKGLLQALVLLTPYELLPPDGLISDDPLGKNPLSWQQWARGCLEDENSTIREIIYFSTSVWFNHSSQQQAAVEVLKKRFASVEALIVEKFGPPKVLTCPMRFEEAFEFI
jgi:hypothetical protein